MSRLGVLVVVVALLGACTDGEDSGPSPRPEDVTPTSVVDYTGVVLQGVGGETTTTIEEKGTARLVGTVTGPSGPVGGATVRIDRLVAGREVRREVVTAADGRWVLEDVPGGRYRVRAFQVPRFVQTSAEIRFLADGEEHAFDLRVEDVGEVVVRADVAPDQPRVGGAVNLVVLVAQRSVSPDGVVRSTPLRGTFVELVGLGRWVLRDDSATGFTGETTSTTFNGTAFDAGVVLSDGGQGRFELRCEQAGAPGLALRIPVLVAPAPAPAGSPTTATPAPTTQDVALDLPDCAESAPAPTTTTTVATTSSTVP